MLDDQVCAAPVFNTKAAVARKAFSLAGDTVSFLPKKEMGSQTVPAAAAAKYLLPSRPQAKGFFAALRMTP